MPGNFFPPLPSKDDGFGFDKLKIWLGSQTVSFQKIITGTLQASMVLSSSNFAAGSAGWQIDGDGNAEFSNVTVRGTIIAGAGSSIGFDDVTAASNTVALEISGGGTLRSDNYSAGVSGWSIEGDGSAEFQDVTVRGTLNADDITVGTLPIARIGANTVDMSKIELTAALETNQVIRSSTFTQGSAGWQIEADGTAEFNGVTLRGTLTLSTTAADTIDFGEGFTLRVYDDNPTSGEDTWWLRPSTDGVDHVIFGPTSASQHLKSIRLRADATQIEWSDAGGDAGSHIFPKGIVYDQGFDTTSAGGTLGVYPVNVTGLAISATVPADISISILTWAWMRVDLTVDQQYAALDVTIGGTLPVNPALEEQDLTTDTDATSGGNNVDVDGNSGAASAGTAHTHVSGTYAVNGSHTHSHNHALSQSWRTLNYFGRRSFTPTGGSITIQARGGVAAGTQVYDDGGLMYMVIIN